MRRTASLLTGMLLLLLSGCGDDGITPYQRMQVERAFQKWKAQGLVHYTVEARILCFCSPAMHEWHELTVAGDDVIAVRLVAGAMPSDAQPGFFDSIDEMFERIREWPGTGRGSRVEATFDEQTGLPIRVSFITSPEILDGGAVYEFRSLKPGLVGFRGQ